MEVLPTLRKNLDAPQQQLTSAAHLFQVLSRHGRHPAVKAASYR
jgi:hypothetical protein